MINASCENLLQFISKLGWTIRKPLFTKETVIFLCTHFPTNIVYIILNFCYEKEKGLISEENMQNIIDTDYFLWNSYPLLGKWIRGYNREYESVGKISKKNRNYIRRKNYVSDHSMLFRLYQEKLIGSGTLEIVVSEPINAEPINLPNKLNHELWIQVRIPKFFDNRFGSIQDWNNYSTDYDDYDENDQPYPIYADPLVSNNVPLENFMFLTSCLGYKYPEQNNNYPIILDPECLHDDPMICYYYRNQTN